MPSLREERLQEQVAEITAPVGQGPRDRREGRGRESGHDRRGAEDLRRDHGQGPQVADAGKQHQHDQEVFGFTRELSDNVIGDLDGGDLDRQAALASPGRPSLRQQPGNRRCPPR